MTGWNYPRRRLARLFVNQLETRYKQCILEKEMEIDNLIGRFEAEMKKNKQNKTSEVRK